MQPTTASLWGWPLGLLAIIPLSTPPAGIDHPSLPHVPADDQLVCSGLASGCRGADSRTGGRAVPAQPKDNRDQPPSYVRTAEVAAVLHLSPKTVARWAKEGKLPFMRTLGGYRRSPQAQIRDLLDSSGRNQRPESADFLDGRGPAAIGWFADGSGTGRLRSHCPCGPAVAPHDGCGFEQIPAKPAQLRDQGKQRLPERISQANGNLRWSVTRPSPQPLPDRSGPALTSIRRVRGLQQRRA
jgi:excisionase family DNA binding protein